MQKKYYDLDSLSHMEVGEHAALGGGLYISRVMFNQKSSLVISAAAGTHPCREFLGNMIGRGEDVLSALLDAVLNLAYRSCTAISINSLIEVLNSTSKNGAATLRLFPSSYRACGDGYPVIVLEGERTECILADAEQLSRYHYES
jgi:hypothetical protein